MVSFLPQQKKVKEPFFKRIKRKISGIGSKKDKGKLSTSLSTESLSDALEDVGRRYNDNATLQDF